MNNPQAFSASEAVFPTIEELWDYVETIFSGSSDSFALIDSSFAYRGVNDAYCQVHGLAREQLLGHKVEEIWGKECFEKTLRKRLERCLLGSDERFQARIEVPPAGIRHFDISFHPYPANGSVPSHVIAVTRDITTSHNTRENASLLLRLAQRINQAPDFRTALSKLVSEIRQFTGWAVGLAWLPTPDGEFLECAASCQNDNGDLQEFHQAGVQARWRRGEGLPGAAWDSKHPHWMPARAAPPPCLANPLAREPGLHARMAIPIEDNDNVVAVLEFLLDSSHPDDQHNMEVVHSVLGQLAPLFQRKRMESAFQESAMRYLTLVETASDVIFFLTPEGIVSSLNNAFEVITGWPREKWLGRNFAPLLHRDDIPAVKSHFSAVLEGTSNARGEFRIRKSDGGFVVGEFNIAPEIRDGFVTGLFGIARDVTERKRTEQALLQSEEHYRELFHHAFQMQEHLRRLSERALRVQEEERMRISRDLHDDIGQSLSAIGMNLAVLEKMLEDPSDEYSQRMTDTRQILQQTLEHVHNFARDLRPSVLDDLGLLPALRSYIKSTAERTGISIRLYVRKDEMIERLDSERKTVAYRVVQEGLTNASKHANASQVVIEVTRNGNFLELVLRDNGQGFSADDRLPAADTNGGLGLLGLSERVRMVNGEFDVVSKVGHGTTLRVTIPFQAV